MKHLVLLLALAIPHAPGAIAQAGVPQTGTISATVTSFGPGNFISAKQHAPFSALLTQQTQQTLNDGVNISRENEEVIMRDAMGRIYRARTVKRVGGSSAGGSSEREPATLITITDPVQHVQYLCSSFRRACTKMAYQPPSARRGVHGLDPEKRPDTTVEDLGSSNISGVEAEGKRVTREIPEGFIGNDRPFTTTEEVWHANELDVDVQVKRSDPRTGSHITTLTNIQPGEPDPGYFQVPAGYRVDERKGPIGALAPVATESGSSNLAGTKPTDR